MKNLNIKKRCALQYSIFNIQYSIFNSEVYFAGRTGREVFTIMKIQANQSGTRSIEITDKHLETIEKYQLFRNLVDSNGFVDEAVLDKLKLNVRALLESSTKDNDLLDLCLDVIYNNNMKALGLHNLVLAYVEWKNKNNGI